jgi:arylsulfatase A-like enzyme
MPPNIVLIVFDAMSAKNLSVYGYPRRTTPNLERLAGRANVYHQHYATGNFTIPGTASLLTGLYPWTHRAINMAGLIARERAHQNVYRVLGSQFHRLAFSQNLWPNYFLGQFGRDVDETLSPAAFSIHDSAVSRALGAAPEDTRRAFAELLFADSIAPGSLVLGLEERLGMYAAAARSASVEYPRGMPQTGNYSVVFKLRDVMNGLIATVSTLSRPSFAYLHLWSPHAPYLPTRAFEGKFLDDWNPEPKPSHRLVDPTVHRSRRTMNDQRRQYDEYIANLDDEFGRLLDVMESSGLLESSYVIVTSDHGELFERGVVGHETPLMYEPVLRIPLLISAPGQRSRRDVSVPTSSVDILPTLAQAAGLPVPDWCEGPVLPGLGGTEEPERSLFMVEAKTERPFAPLSRGSFSMRKGRYKLIDYMGHPQYRVQHRLEMYDLEDDPEELTNIFSDTMAVARSMQEELMTRIEDYNAQFVR